MKKLILLLLLLRGVTPSNAQCLSGNCNNGYGSAIFKKKGGVRFTGQFQNRKPHGQGKAVYPDGTRYEGTWFNGTMNGVGTLTLSDGTALSGVWRNSRFLGTDTSFLRENTYAAISSTPTPPKTENITIVESSQPTEKETVTRVDEFEATTPAQTTSPTVVEILPNNESSLTLPKVWTLAVGISNYELPSILTLKYPHSDAFRMYAFWKSPEGGSLDDKHSQVLVNDQATKQGILDSMRQMFMQAAPNDLVAFFYSGHGLKGAFLPTDYDGNNVRLFHTEVNDLLSACPAKYKLVIADACNSGSYLAVKSPTKSIFESSSQRDVQDAFFRELNRASAGTAYILSSQADEESLEVSTLHQSIFSYFVLRGMKGEANTNDDEVITIKELFDYVYQKVTTYAKSLGKIQTPVLKGNFDPNMPVAMIRK
ncbi:MAG: caspase family protein [Saprospiraceae bacterium]|nr:caspase family protein [Saprospiraceae bacterium]